LTYFPDLTEYTYTDLQHPDRRVVNVGWLSREAAFATGTVPPQMMPVLRRMVASPRNLTRGYNFCEFCLDRLSGGLATRQVTEQLLSVGGAGNGEILVPDPDGHSYAAPVLIVHYIESHGYQPPAGFCSAVLLLTH